MTLQDIVDRCTKYSGYNLEARMRGKQLIIEDPAVGPNSGLRLIVHPMSDLLLHETYGRLRQWNINREEYDVLLHHLLSENE